MLHFFNLIAFSKIRIRDCIFQDQNSRRMIGNARMIDSLYYFDESSFNNKITHCLNSISSPLVKEHIILGHRRLGHPSFLTSNIYFQIYLRELIFNLLIVKVVFLQTNLWYTYFPKPYKASKPFYLIHIDVWGHSKITTHTGKGWFITFIDDHTRLSWVYLMQTKFEVKDNFKHFYNTSFFYGDDLIYQ